MKHKTIIRAKQLALELSEDDESAVALSKELGIEADGEEADFVIQSLNELVRKYYLNEAEERVLRFQRGGKE